MSEGACKLSIGSHMVRNNAFLAPMAGITDAPFRELAWRYGAGYVVSEMLGVQGALWHTEKSRLRRVPVAGIEPRAVQIAGGDPHSVAEAARRHVDEGAQIIDINFGCPAKKVCRKAAGSQLLKDPDLVAEIARETVAAVPVPVTVKMRTGWSTDMKHGAAIAYRLQEEGVAAVTVHGRTRACRFEGEAEHDTVAEIKSRLRVPVFANGDIGSPAQANAVMERTGVDGVMIGRSALGAPWLLGMVADPARREPGVREKWAVMAGHVAALHEFYGEARGVRVARKHVQWYLAHLLSDPAPARIFNGLTDGAAQLDWLAAMGGRAAA